MAIVLDAADANMSAASATSLTFSHTCNGSYRMLAVFVETRGGTAAGADDVVTGVTYNSVAMTRVNTIGNNDPLVYARGYWYFLYAPTTGANNVVISCSLSTDIRGLATSYRGVKQSGIPDASATTNVDTTTAGLITMTTLADNCWMVMGTYNGAGEPTAGANTTRRGTSSGGGFGFFDSNGALTPAGSKTLNWDLPSGNGETGTLGFSFAPQTSTITYLGSGDAGSTSGTSHSSSVSIPATTDFLIIIPSRWRTVAGTTVAPTSVTVNGVASTGTGLTPYGDQDTRWIGAFYHYSPPTGSQTIVASGGGIASDVTQYSWFAYSGVAQSGQPDASYADVGESNSAAYPVSVTVVAANSWVLAGFAAQGTSPTGYTNGTTRILNSGGGTTGCVADSNGPVEAGAYTITQIQTSQFTSALSISFKEASTASTKRFTMLGVG